MPSEESSTYNDEAKAQMNRLVKIMTAGVVTGGVLVLTQVDALSILLTIFTGIAFCVVYLLWEISVHLQELRFET